MTQQSHSWAYAPRKPDLKETRAPQCSSQHCLIAKTWKQPRCPSADEWIRKRWYIYTMEYCSAIKKNSFESVLMRWMKLEPIILSEVSQKEKYQYSIIMHICGIEKDGNDSPIWKTEKEILMYRTDFWTLREKARVGYFERTALKHVYYQGWNRSPAQVGCMRQVLGAGALGRPRGVEWGGTREGGWGIHVNPWLIHVNVWQKPLQYCKVISLQLIKINGKKREKYALEWVKMKTWCIKNHEIQQKQYMLREKFTAVNTYINKEKRS